MRNEKLSKIIALKNYFKKRKLKKDSTETVKKNKFFRLSAKNLFLTYPNCNFKLEDVKNYLFQPHCLGKYIIKDFLLVKENNQKDQHVHAFLKLSKKCDIKSGEILNLFIEEKIKKGNYQSAKNIDYTIQYLLKDIQNKYDTERILYSKDLNNKITNFGEFLSLDETMLYLARKGEIEEALDLCLKENPKRYLLERFNLEKLLKKHFLNELGFQTKFSLKDFVIPDSIRESFEKSEKTLFVVGRSGIGKSQLAQAYLKELKLHPLIVNNLDGLRFFNANVHNCILYDDVNFSHLERETLLKLFEYEDDTTIPIKHGTISIPKRTRKFILSNKKLEHYVKFELDEAILRRLQVIELPNVNLFAVKEIIDVVDINEKNS